MPCIDCKDNRYTCGTTLSSSCVWFTGEYPSFITDDEKCKPNINDIFKAYGTKLDFLVTQSNVKSLDKKCLGYDSNSITPLSLFQLYNNEICALKQKVSDLESLLTNLDIGSKTLVIDLKCLSSDGSACATTNNTYTLQSILNVLINKECN